MKKHILYVALFSLGAVASCSKKSADTIPPYSPHYPKTECSFDSLADISLTKNGDTTFTVPVTLYFTAFMPTVLTVSWQPMSSHITISPMSASTDTLTHPFNPSFSFHMNTADTGTFPVTISGSADAPLAGTSYAGAHFNIIVH